MTEQRSQRQDQVNYTPPAGPALFKAALRGAMLAAKGVYDAEILVHQARDQQERRNAEINLSNKQQENRDAMLAVQQAQAALAGAEFQRDVQKDAEQKELTEENIARAREIIENEVPDELQPYYELGLINAQLGGLGIQHENVMEQIGARGKEDRKTKEEERNIEIEQQEALETSIAETFGKDPELANLMILEAKGVQSAGTIATATVKERQEVAQREAEAKEKKEQQRTQLQLLSKLKGRNAISQDTFDIGTLAIYGEEPMANFLSELAKNAASTAEIVNAYKEEIDAWTAQGLIPPKVQKDFLGPVQQRMLADPAIRLIRTAKRAIDMIDMSSEITHGKIGPNAVNELLALYGLIRAADPGSVVREGEIAIFITGRSDVEAILERVKKIGEPTILTDVEHAAILSFAKGLRAAYAEDYRAIVGAYEAILEGQGLLNRRDASGKLIHATSPRTIIALPGLDPEETADATKDDGPTGKPPTPATPSNYRPQQMSLEDNETNQKAAEDIIKALRQENKSITEESVRELLEKEGQPEDAIIMTINYLRNKGHLQDAN